MDKSVKIQINRYDDLPEIAEKVFSANAEEVILVVPKNSRLAEIPDGLKFIKKGLAGKKDFIIESVDSNILELARKAKISATNPFFGNYSSQATLAAASNIESNINDKDENGNGEVVGNEVFAKAEKELERAFKPQSQRNIRWGRMIMTVLVLVVLGVWMSVSVLPKADITITTKKTNWEFKNYVVIDKKATANDIVNLKIPGQVFSQKKNAQMSFAAVGRKYSEQKSKGKIIIYNAYSSASQSLVASTRFSTPDGKIFRITENISIPGADIVDGKIIPSAVDAVVVADKAGESYNVGPIAKLTIPGFKGSPKFDGFYGEIKAPISGGFTGEVADPKPEEIAMAKKKVSESLRDSIQVALTSQIPAEFKILEKSNKFKITDERLNMQINDKNEFSVFMEAELSVLGFREKDLLAALEQNMKKELGDDYVIKSQQLSYQPNIADPDNIKLAVNFSAVAERPVKTADLKKDVAGKSESELKAMIFSSSNLEKIKVSLTPFWLNRVPKNPSKIGIVVD